MYVYVHARVQLHNTTIAHYTTIAHNSVNYRLATELCAMVHTVVLSVPKQQLWVVGVVCGCGWCCAVLCVSMWVWAAGQREPYRLSSVADPGFWKGGSVPIPCTLPKAVPRGARADLSAQRVEKSFFLHFSLIRMGSPGTFMLCTASSRCSVCLQLSST